MDRQADSFDSSHSKFVQCQHKRIRPGAVYFRKRHGRARDDAAEGQYAPIGLLHLDGGKVSRPLRFDFNGLHVLFFKSSAPLLLRDV